VWGAFTAETVGDDAETDANISLEALATDAAAIPEVRILGSGFILG
jgi:hypothetical protein